MCAFASFITVPGPRCNIFPAALNRQCQSASTLTNFRLFIMSLRRFVGMSLLFVYIEFVSSPHFATAVFVGSRCSVLFSVFVFPLVFCSVVLSYLFPFSMPHFFLGSSVLNFSFYVCFKTFVVVRFDMLAGWIFFVRCSAFLTLPVLEYCPWTSSASFAQPYSCADQGGAEPHRSGCYPQNSTASI